MSREEKAIDKLADEVIKWQTMYNGLSDRMDRLDGNSRLRVLIESKERIISSAMGELEDDE